jgi:RimJ/RimL family protein N-acetyltransferase
MRSTALFDEVTDRGRSRTSSASYGALELRPLEPGDRASLMEIFAGMGPRSRQLRFLTPKPRLTETDLRHLTAVDDHGHVAVLAVSRASGRPIGVARFIRTVERPELADVAVSVVDAWQGRGVGARLTRALVQRALEVGVRRFTLLVQRDNEAALRLLGRSRGSATLVAADSETLELEVDLELG